MKTTNFVAIDFETMTSELTSACAIGMVKVINGHLQQSFYSLINPIPDDKTRDNIAVHGITHEMAADAPSFWDLYSTIKGFVKDLPLVCHNRGTDINVLSALMDFYCVDDINVKDNYCTYEITGLSLDDCCKKYGIPMGVHHNALDDAMACAKVFLACQGDVVATTFRGGIKAAMASAASKKFERSTLDPLDDDLVLNQDTVFFHANVVITGTFAAYPNRNDLGKMIQALGADINTGISSKTTVVVMGQGAGPSKLKKIGEWQAKGHDIRIIYEEELKQILNYGKE